MDRCDVLIVGGGPAGSSCAWALVRAGFDVVVLDAKSFPRDKVCAGWITPAVLEELEVDAAAYARGGRVLQEIRGFRTGWMDGRQVETQFGRAASWGIRRCEFDEFLLRRSAARLLLNTPLATLARSGDRWIVNDEISAAMLVGAGGHFCPVARRMGARRGAEKAVVAREVEFEMDPRQARECGVRAGVPELFFSRDRSGYGWCVRKGDWLNVGLGRLGGRGMTAETDAFVDGLRKRGKIPAAGPAFRGHAYLLRSTSARSAVGSAVALLGDAAGLAWPESGEGIRPAVESGLLAAQVIASAGKPYARERLEPYGRLLDERFGRAGEGPLTGRVPGWVMDTLAGPALENRWFVRNVLLNRWFLHAAMPPLRAA